MKNKPIIKSADLSWTENDAPYSTRFDDIYFMPDAGLAESRHVFLSANLLPKRWLKLSSEQTFTIFECGFGTGLNFLVTSELWLASNVQGHLNYTAIEGYPLSLSELAKALSNFATDLPLTQTLIAKYEELITGQRVQITQQISLKLIVCEADALSEQNTEISHIDSVYMDGFSPANNPEMWSLELCQWLYAHCSVGASLSTFTVAGLVKRNLKAAGFVIKKVPGFGKKREMLTAQKVAS